MIVPSDKLKALSVVWDALHLYRDAIIPEGTESNDENWSDICHSMAIIHETLNIDQSEI